MPVRSELSVVLTTLPHTRGARALSKALVKEGFAACANLLPVASVFRWKGSLEEGNEVLVVFKVPQSGVGALQREIARRHPYEVPEIVEIPAKSVNPSYLAWAKSVVRPRRR